MKVKFLFGVVFVLFAAGSVFAQNSQELRIGSSISGNLGRGQEIWYSVTAAQDGLLTVETSGNTDTYLEAYDSRRNLIVENDDGPNNLNARVLISVTRGNTYLFKLRGYDSSASGPFSISASNASATQLRAGSTYNGIVNEAQGILFRFTADRSGMLTVETSGQTDTTITLYDDKFEYLDSDDDSAEYPNDRIIYPVLSGRTFYIDVNAFESGPFGINASIAPFVQLQPGSLYNGNIGYEQIIVFSFTADRNGMLTVETSGRTDTYITLYDENFEYLDSDDDSAGGINDRITYRVSSRRVYFIEVGAYGEGPFGISARIQ